MPVVLEVGAGVVLLLTIIIVAERAGGTASKAAQVVLVLLGVAAVTVGLYYLARWFGVIGPIQRPDV